MAEVHILISWWGRFNCPFQKIEAVYTDKIAASNRHASLTEEYKKLKIEADDLHEELVAIEESRDGEIIVDTGEGDTPYNRVFASWEQKMHYSDYDRVDLISQPLL